MFLIEELLMNLVTTQSNHFYLMTRESINNTVKGIDFTGVYSSGVLTTDDGGTVI